MRERLRAVLVGVIALLGVGLVAPTPAGAITGGTEDTANEYSNVALILFCDGARYRCSATPVSPTVLVNAAHCTFGTDGDTIVTFDPDVARNPDQAAVEIPRAANPAVGFTAKDVAKRPGWYIGAESR